MEANTDSLRARIASADELDWNETLSEILRAFDCTTGTLHVWDAGQNVLAVVAHQGIPDFLLPKMSLIPIGKGMAGIAAERRAPVQVCNLQTDDSGVARPSARDTKMEGSLAIPLLHAEHLYGTLGIAKPVPYDFSDAEIKALEQIGEAICQRLRDVQPV